MATKLKSLPPSVNKGRSKYPWDEWLDGNAWELVRGEDFAGDLEAMRSLIYQAAHARSGKARVRAPKGGDRLYLQFYEP